MRPTLVFWLLPLLLVAGAAAYVRKYEHELPDRIPTHYGVNGPDRWAPKSPRTVYGPLLLGALVLLNLTTMGVAMSRSRLQSASMVANQRLLLAVCYATAFMFAVFGSAPVRDLNGITVPGWIPIGILIGVLVAFGWPVLKTGNMESQATPGEAWKGGVFYYNRADPALVVSKRFGVGVTLNMAHKAAWLFVAQTVVLVAASIWLTRG